MKFLAPLFTLFFSFYFKSQTLQSINHNGVDRVYFYYTPSDYSPNQSLPLLVVLHGLTQTGGGVMDITNFNAIAEQEKFIVVYPSGLSNAWNATNTRRSGYVYMDLGCMLWPQSERV